MLISVMLMKLRIRDLREDRDLKQAALAEHLRIHQTTYSDYELGKLNIPVSVLHALADYYQRQGIENELSKCLNCQGCCDHDHGVEDED